MSSYGTEPSTGDPYGQPHQPPAAPAPYWSAPGQVAAGPQAPYQPAGYAPGPYAPGPYGGHAGAPARPGGVAAAAVLGFVWGALGVLVTVALLVYGAAATSLGDAPGFLGDAIGAAGGILLFFGVLALAWTVVTIWGSVWALTGRSRVLLIVGGSIAIAGTGLTFLGGIGSVEDEGPGGLVVGLVGLVVSILIVVLLSNRQASGWFAAQRARRPH
ncbi:hypothetical protein [Blastococcus sp. SYSU D00695]